MGLDFSRRGRGRGLAPAQASRRCAAAGTGAASRAGSFAAITMFHVLEHLPDPCAYLCRGAQPAGARMAAWWSRCPTPPRWQFRLLGRRWNGMDVPRHLFDYRDRDLERCSIPAGFEVVRRKYFSLRDNPAGLASSLAPGLDPMARRVRAACREGAAAGWPRTWRISRWPRRRCPSRWPKRPAAPATRS